MAEVSEAGLRLAIYARVSTEEQRDGQTIDSQIAELDKFARERAWIIAGTYKDDGWSGAMMERPELDHLRDDALRGVFDAVLINDVDRLARDVAHLGIIKRDLEKKGIKVIFRKLPTDASPTSNLMVNILGSFAEFERELIADRTRRGRRHKVETRQQYLGSNTSYGYRYVPIDRLGGRDGFLEINPDEARVVRRMFEWVDQEGLSARRVMLRLNQSGIRPKKGASTWGKSTVLRILKNEMYAGVWHYNKSQGCEPLNPKRQHAYRRHRKCSKRQRPKRDWIALSLSKSLHIIPHNRWERVQQQLARNLCFSPRNEKHSYLLKGLVRCGACGSRYIGDPCHGKYYYRCISRCKRLPSVAEMRIDQAVKLAVEQVVLNPATILEPMRKVANAQKKERAETATAAAQADRELRQLVKEEERILGAYRTGVISPSMLAHELEKLNGRRSALNVTRDEFRVAKPMLEQTERAVHDFCAAAARNLASFTHDQWRELLRAAIAEIIFQGDQITIRGRIPVDSAATGIEFGTVTLMPACPPGSASCPGSDV